MRKGKSTNPASSTPDILQATESLISRETEIYRDFFFFFPLEYLECSCILPDTWESTVAENPFFIIDKILPEGRWYLDLYLGMCLEDGLAGNRDMCFWL